MNIVEEWFDTAGSLLESPREFFETESRISPVGYPLKFAAVSIVVAAALNTARAGLFGMFVESSALVNAVSTLAGSIFGGIVGITIGAAFAHLFVYILGGRNGIGNTIAVYEYITVISPITALLSFIPLLGGIAAFGVAIYGLYMQVKGISELQDLSTLRATVAVLMPIVIVFGLALALIFAAWSAPLMSASTVPTAPQ